MGKKSISTLQFLLNNYDVTLTFVGKGQTHGIPVQSAFLFCFSCGMGGKKNNSPIQKNRHSGMDAVPVNCLMRAARLSGCAFLSAVQTAIFQRKST